MVSAPLSAGCEPSVWARAHDFSHERFGFSSSEPRTSDQRRFLSVMYCLPRAANARKLRTLWLLLSWFAHALSVPSSQSVCLWAALCRSRLPQQTRTLAVYLFRSGYQLSDFWQGAELRCYTPMRLWRLGLCSSSMPQSSSPLPRSIQSPITF